MKFMHFPPKLLEKPPLPYSSMVHLLHRLYGVDAPNTLVLYKSHYYYYYYYY